MVKEAELVDFKMADLDQAGLVVRADDVEDKTSVTIMEKELIHITPTQTTFLQAPLSIHKVPDLGNDPDLLHELVCLINEVYTNEEKDYSSGFPRFPKDQDLIEQFGPNALCAIIRREHRIVATASITPFSEPAGSMADKSFRNLRPDDYHLVETGYSFEISGVATMKEPEVRGKGLATQCIESLQKAILALNAGHEFLVWIHTAEHQNGAYWRRRGFENVLIEWKPKGYWGAWEPFQYTTLVKKVGGLNAVRD